MPGKKKKKVQALLFSTVVSPWAVSEPCRWRTSSSFLLCLSILRQEPLASRCQWCSPLLHLRTAQESLLECGKWWMLMKLIQNYPQNTPSDIKVQIWTKTPFGKIYNDLKHPTMLFSWFNLNYLRPQWESITQKAKNLRICFIWKIYTYQIILRPERQTKHVSPNVLWQWSENQKCYWKIC